MSTEALVVGGAWFTLFVVAGWIRARPNRYDYTPTSEED